MQVDRNLSRTAELKIWVAPERHLFAGTASLVAGRGFSGRPARFRGCLAG